MILSMNRFPAEDTGAGTDLLGTRMGLGVEGTGGLTTGGLGATEGEEIGIKDGEREDARVIVGGGGRGVEVGTVISEAVIGVGVRSGDVELSGIVESGEDMEVELGINDGGKVASGALVGVGVRSGEVELAGNDESGEGMEVALVKSEVGMEVALVKSEVGMEVALVISEAGVEENEGAGESQVEFASTGGKQSVGRLTVLASMVMAWRARSLPTIVEFDPTEIDA